MLVLMMPAYLPPHEDTEMYSISFSQVCTFPKSRHVRGLREWRSHCRKEMWGAWVWSTFTHLKIPQDKCATTDMGQVRKVSRVCDRAFPHGHLRVCWVSQGSVCMGGSSRIPASWGTVVPRAGPSCVEALSLLFRTSLLKTAQVE